MNTCENEFWQSPSTYSLAWERLRTGWVQSGLLAWSHSWENQVSKSENQRTMHCCQPWGFNLFLVSQDKMALWMHDTINPWHTCHEEHLTLSHWRAFSLAGAIAWCSVELNNNTRHNKTCPQKAASCSVGSGKWKTPTCLFSNGFPGTWQSLPFYPCLAREKVRNCPVLKRNGRGPKHKSVFISINVSCV